MLSLGGSVTSVPDLPPSLALLPESPAAAGGHAGAIFSPSAAAAGGDGGSIGLAAAAAPSLPMHIASALSSGSSRPSSPSPLGPGAGAGAGGTSRQSIGVNPALLTGIPKVASRGAMPPGPAYTLSSELTDEIGAWGGKGGGKGQIGLLWLGAMPPGPAYTLSSELTDEIGAWGEAGSEVGVAYWCMGGVKGRGGKGELVSEHADEIGALGGRGREVGRGGAAGEQFHG